MKFKDMQRRTPLEDVYLQAFNHKLVIPNPNPVKLRPSGFPTCSIINYAKLEYHKRHNMLLDDTSLFGDFFTSVGTTVHTVMQKWIGLSGQMYGDWKCVNCDTTRRMVGHVCPKCNTFMEYNEIEVEYGLVTGHVDGILQLPNKKFWTIDYKTATIKKIQEAHKLLPIKQNVFQILAYSYILKHNYDLDIEGASLLYIARNNPKYYKECQLIFDEETEEFAHKIITKEIEKYKAALQASKRKNVNIAIEAKPCKSVEHHASFFGEYHVCPFIDVCFKSNKALVRRIEELLD